MTFTVPAWVLWTAVGWAFGVATVVGLAVIVSRAGKPKAGKAQGGKR